MGSSDTIEIVVLPLKRGSIIEEPVKKFLDVVSKQPGYVQAFWGRQVEAEDKLQIFIVWDRIESHERFIASEGDFKAAGKALEPIIGGAPETFHAQIDKHQLTKVLTAPVVEIMVAYNLSASFEAGNKSLSEALPNARGYKGSAAGTIVEELPLPQRQALAKSFITIIGWESVDAHLAALKTKDFEELLPTLKEIAEEIKLHHATLVEFK